MDLNPIGEPPFRAARWCPRCQAWTQKPDGWPLVRPGRRCLNCGTALVRQTKPELPKPGELRPGVIAEFDDPRDRYDPSRELAEMRRRTAPRS